MRVGVHRDEWYPVFDLFEVDEDFKLAFEIPDKMVAAYMAAQEAHGAALDMIVEIVNAQNRERLARGRAESS